MHPLLALAQPWTNRGPGHRGVPGKHARSRRRRLGCGTGGTRPAGPGATRPHKCPPGVPDDGGQAQGSRREWSWCRRGGRRRPPPLAMELSGAHDGAYGILFALTAAAKQYRPSRARGRVERARHRLDVACRSSCDISGSPFDHHPTVRRRRVKLSPLKSLACPIRPHPPPCPAVCRRGCCYNSPPTPCPRSAPKAESISSTDPLSHN